MKTDFKNINLSHIDKGSVFYLYGNYKKTFDIFCLAAFSALYKKSLNIERHFCSVAECIKIENGQYNLFDTKTNCFCIKNIEDNHLEKVQQLLSRGNNIFILESGGYFKSKKITDYFLKDNNVSAIASFNNDATLHSLCKMFFSDLDLSMFNEIVKIINHTNEELYSIFKKISILLDGNSLEDIKNYSTYENSFLEKLDTIPLIRFLLQSAIKEKIFQKPTTTPNIDLSDKGIINFLVDAELKQKSGFKISRNYIYHKLMNIPC